MSIINKEKDAIPSKITPQQFAKALASVDLKAIPKHKRKAALADAIITIMIETITDEGKKDQLRISQMLHRQRHGVG